MNKQERDYCAKKYGVYFKTKEETMESICCPQCGCSEMHPDGDKVLIRAYKVYSANQWWSECLVCSGEYDEDSLKWLGISDVIDDEDRFWF
jgi:hypothetical protein